VRCLPLEDVSCWWCTVVYVGRKFLAHGCKSTPINPKICSNFKFRKKDRFLLETKDDQVLYSHIEMFGQEMICMDFRSKKKIKHMANIVWIVYGQGAFQFCYFYPGYYDSNSLTKYFYTSTILIHNNCPSRRYSNMNEDVMFTRLKTHRVSWNLAPN
jgi:hypothetical protein